MWPGASKTNKNNILNHHLKIEKLDDFKALFSIYQKSIVGCIFLYIINIYCLNDHYE